MITWREPDGPPGGREVARGQETDGGEIMLFGAVVPRGRRVEKSFYLHMTMSPWELGGGWLI